MLCSIGLLMLNSGTTQAGQETTRVSVKYGTENGEPNASSSQPDISADGRYVAFDSAATDLLSTKDSQLHSDIFVRDLTNQTTERISVKYGTAIDEPNTFSYRPAISAHGRYVAFESYATNLLSTPDLLSYTDIFVRDRTNQTTERVSVKYDTESDEPNSSSSKPAISADGSYVAFESYATNLLSTPDSLSYTDIFIRDRLTDTTERISISTTGGEPNGSSFRPAISADGRFVAFESSATNLLSTPDSLLNTDIFVRDRITATTERISISTTGGEPHGSSGYPDISADGRYVAFGSLAPDLVENDTNGLSDVFIFDRQTKMTELVSVNSNGEQQTGGDNTGYGGVLSADGRYVTFSSEATNLVDNDTGGFRDLFRRDRKKGVTIQVSVNTAGEAQNGWVYEQYSISGDGRFLAFMSQATNLVEPNDVQFNNDIFLREEEKEFFWPLFLPGKSKN